MIEKLVIAWLKARIDAEAAKATPVGGTVTARKVARGIRILGMEFEADVLLRRTK